MAQRRTTTLIDDLDGSEAVETVRLAMSGPEYEIELSALHARQLRAALSPFVARARRVRGGRGSARPARPEPLRIGVTIDPDWPGRTAGR